MSAAGQSQRDSGAHWQRIADLRLRLSPDAEVDRQETRGQLWYVVRDRLGDRFYRVDPSVYLFLALLDGRRTVDEAFTICTERRGEDAPSETEIIRLFWRLHAAGLLVGDVAARTDELVARAEQSEQRRVLQQLRSPLAIRIPLLDPDRLLDRVRWMAHAFFSPLGFVLWLVVVGTGLGYVAVNWGALGANFSDRVLAFDNLILISLVFPVVKAFHELGHGLALKRWGCETHETGIMFLVFMPVPYVDASSSVSIQEPWRRAAVGAAGLYVELFIASLATIAWAHMEPGLGRAVAFNVMIIAGASAVLFNGNPLLKFDAYYILSDLIEIPNLAQRANEWWFFQIQTRLLGARNAQNPVEVPGERPWFIFYAPAALAYRLFLMSVIILFVAQQAFFLGVILAGLAVLNIILMPIWRGLVFLATSPRLKKGRVRAIAVTTVVVGGLGALLFLAPAPYRTMTEGVVWYSEGAELRPAASGHVEAFPARSGEHVARDAPIVLLDAPDLEAEYQALTARLTALEAQRRRELAEDRARAALTAEEIAFLRERLENVRQRRAGLTLLSPAAGLLVVPDQADLDDGWLGRGQPIGHVVGDGPMTVRAALTQGDMELVSERLDGIEVRLAGNVLRPIGVRMGRQVPDATDRLPAMLLATEGGGPFSVRPPGPGDDVPRTLETIYVVELILPPGTPARFGERAYVRFDHGTEPIAVQWQRALRQLLLREFNA